MPVPVAPPDTSRGPSEIGGAGDANLAAENDERHRSDGDTSESSALKRRRTLPPKERMVTRGVSAAQLAQITSEFTQPTQPPNTPAPKSKRTHHLTYKTTPSSPKQHLRSIRRDRPKGLQSLSRSSSHLGSGRSERNGELEGYNLYAWKLRVEQDRVLSLPSQANKVLTTRDWQYAREEFKQMKVMQKVEALSQEQNWSFRQIARHIPPPRPKSHWDLLLDEMKWLREDFRQERRWKIAAAYTMAQWVMEWHQAADKSTVCIDRQRSISLMLKSPAQDVTMGEASVDESPQRGQKRPREEDEEDVTMQNGEINDGPKLNNGIHTDSASPTILVDYDTSTFSVTDLSSVQRNEDNTYGPPLPESSCPYFEGGNHRIIPVTKLMAEKRIAQDVYRWDEWGRSKDEYAADESVKWLPGSERYSPAPVQSAIFLPHDSDVKEYVPSQPKAIPAKSASWTPEENEALTALAVEYKKNWDLISEALRGIRQRRGVQPHTGWECYQRFQQIAAGRPTGQNGVAGPDAEPSASGGSLDADVKPTISARGDAVNGRKDKYSKYSNTFEIIKRIAKRRDQRQPSAADRRPPSKITLNPHETHLTAQHSAGINPDVPLSPYQLTILRDNRTKELRAQHPDPRQMHGGFSRMANVGRPNMMQAQVPLQQQYAHQYRPRPPVHHNGPPQSNPPMMLPPGASPVPMRPTPTVNAQLTPPVPAAQLQRSVPMAVGQDRMKAMMAAATPLMQPRAGMNYVGGPAQMHMQHLGDPNALPQGAAGSAAGQQYNMNRVAKQLQMQQLQQQHQQQQQARQQQVYNNEAQQAAAQQAIQNAQNALKLNQQLTPDQQRLVQARQQAALLGSASTGSPHIPMLSPQIPVGSQAPLPSPRLTSVQQNSPRLVANAIPAGSPSPRPVTQLVTSMMNQVPHPTVGVYTPPIVSASPVIPAHPAGAAQLNQQTAVSTVPVTAPVASPRFTQQAPPPTPAANAEVQPTPPAQPAPSPAISNATSESNGGP
ncbi:chromatin modification- protein VID21 [Rhizophlyctis rosea]|nr:chromatin modification- protein VID21 [Rhizophlyctis rosea]